MTRKTSRPVSMCTDCGNPATIQIPVTLSPGEPLQDVHTDKQIFLSQNHKVIRAPGKSQLHGVPGVRGDAQHFRVTDDLGVSEAAVKKIPELSHWKRAVHRAGLQAEQQMRVL